MATYELQLPLKNSEVEKLHVGDTVYVTGKIFTSRDMAHLEFKNILAEGKELPVDFNGGAIFHAGPVVRRKDDGWELIVIGPTTSFRMEPYANMVGEMGVKLIIGKGGMREDSSNAYEKYKQVYLQAPPGCAVKLAAAVTKVSGGYWLEKGMPEALWILEAVRFGPLAVTMDSHGESIYRNIKESALEKVKNF